MLIIEVLRDVSDELARDTSFDVKAEVRLEAADEKKASSQQDETSTVIAEPKVESDLIDLSERSASHANAGPGKLSLLSCSVNHTIIQHTSSLSARLQEQIYPVWGACVYVLCLFSLSNNLDPYWRCELILIFSRSLAWPLWNAQKDVITA